MFIKLTSRYANRTIHVRPEDIAMVRFPDHPVDEEDDGMAEITVHGVLGAIPVKETPEQIMEMINGRFAPKSGSMKPEPPKSILADEFGNVINENGDDRKC